MLTTDDVESLACGPELVEAGLSYACRSLANHHVRANLSGYAQVRRMAAGAMAELAFRHHLVEQGVPFEVARPPAFGDPGRFVVTLRGRHCDLRSYLITDQRQVACLGANPELLLQVPALIPVEDYADEGKSPEDLCLFAFIPAATAQSHDGIVEFPGIEIRSHLLYLMPAGWAHPRRWIPLGSLAAKAERGTPMEFRIGGEDRDRQPLVKSMTIGPGTRVEIEGDYHSLTYLHAKTRPTGRVGLHCSSQSRTLVIGPGDWQDVWFEAANIYLVGWLSREEFRLRARLLRAGTRVFQFSRTRVDNLAVDVSNLKPIDRLLEKASQTWSPRSAGPTRP